MTELEDISIEIKSSIDDVLNRIQDKYNVEISFEETIIEIRKIEPKENKQIYI